MRKGENVTADRQASVLLTWVLCLPAMCPQAAGRSHLRRTSRVYHDENQSAGPGNQQRRRNPNHGQSYSTMRDRRAEEKGYSNCERNGSQPDQAQSSPKNQNQIRGNVHGPMRRCHAQTGSVIRGIQEELRPVPPACRRSEHALVTMVTHQ